MEERRGKGYFVEGALLVAGRAVVEVLLAHSWVRWLGRKWGGDVRNAVSLVKGEAKCVFLGRDYGLA